MQSQESSTTPIVSVAETTAHEAVDVPGSSLDHSCNKYCNLIGH